MINSRTGVIIASGGLGIRFGNPKPKQFLEIKGMPVIALAIDKFQQCEEVDQIVISSHRDYIDETETIVRNFNFSKVVSVVPGGEIRQDSVWNGIREIANLKCDILLIHDAVRPFVTTRLIKEVIKNTREHGAAIPIITPKDTIKIVNNDDNIVKTLDRSILAAAQTPQGFQTDLIIEAYEKAYSDNIYSTDDASLVERIEKAVKAITGENTNIKITTVEDLQFAKILISGEN